MSLQVPPLLAVGLEGLFGMLTLTVSFLYTNYNLITSDSSS